MPDLEPLPPIRAPRLTPRADDFADLTVRVARRRRQRRAQAAGGLAAAAVVAGLLASLGGSPQTLRTVDPAATGPSAPDAPTSDQPTPEPDASGSAAAGPGGVSPSPALPGTSTAASAGPTAAPGGRGGSAGSSTAPGQPSRGAPTAVRTDVEFDTSGDVPTCEASQYSVDSAAYCNRFLGPFETPTGATRSYAYEVCRSPRTGSGQLTFESDQEFEIYLSTFDSQTERWRWSEGHPFARRTHTLPTKEGRCWRWTYTWDTRDARGRLLPVGDYVLTAQSLANELNEVGFTGPVIAGGESSSTISDKEFRITD